MMMISINLYISLLIFVALFLIFICVCALIDNPIRSNEANTFKHLKQVVDFYYMRNLTFCVLILALYLLFGFCIFLILRWNSLHVTKALLTSDAINLENICIFILTYLTVVLYVLSLTVVCYPYIIRLHFYLVETTWYSKIFLDFLPLKFHLVYLWLADFWKFLAYITKNKHELIKEYKKEFTLYKNFGTEALAKKKRQYKNLLYFSFFVQKYNKLRHFIVFLQHITFKIKQMSLIHKAHTPFNLVLLTLFYDMFHGCFYYVYYALLLFYITTIIHKIRYFYFTKDPMIDGMLKRFYYDTSFKGDLQPFRFNRFNNDIITNTEEILNYFKNNLTVSYLLEDSAKANNKYNIKAGKNRNYIYLALMTVLYFGYNYDKYFIIIAEQSIPLYTIISLFVILMIIIYNKIEIINKLESKRTAHKGYYRTFKVLTYIFIIIVTYILLYNRFAMIPSEIILNILDYIHLKEILTPDDKIMYAKRLLYQIHHISQKDSTIIETQMQSIIEKINENTELTFEQIKEYITENNPIKIKEQRALSVEAIKERIEKWFGIK